MRQFRVDGFGVQLLARARYEIGERCFLDVAGRSVQHRPRDLVPRNATSAPGQSALLMADVAGFLASRGVRFAVIGAMAAAVHGVVRASLDADAVVALQVREAQTLRQALIAEGLEVALRIGDVDDPIPGLLEIKDRHGNRVDLLLGLRGMDPGLLNRTRQVRLAETVLEIVGDAD